MTTHTHNISGLKKKQLQNKILLFMKFMKIFNFEAGLENPEFKAIASCRINLHLTCLQCHEKCIKFFRKNITYVKGESTNKVKTLEVQMRILVKEFYF